MPRPHILALALAAITAASCSRPQPVVSSPPRVRVDTAESTAAATPVRMAPLVVSLGEARAPAPRTVSDDPLHRIDRMDWPGPSRYRSANGAPGPDYWQQRADYTIAVTLDTTARSVRGTVAIRYTNNSPDTLRMLWLQLDQNLYRPGSEGSVLYPSESRWGVRGFQGGYDLEDVTVNGRRSAVKVNDTMGRIDLDQPGQSIAPRGGTATIAIRYAFRVPEHGSDRMGRDSALYEIAQWYPRMAVYDDVRGWNPDPYLGQGEFYLEYGDIDYSVTVPAGYVVAGSGVLQNPRDVLTAAQRDRLARAARSPSTVPIITREEADAARRTAVSGTRTWRFRAERVRDVAWAAAPDFRWDATSWNGILTQAFYQFPKAGRAWEQGAEMTQWAIRTYSQLWFPFPYPQATSVAGPVGGMEYPMFVMVHHGTDDPRSIFGTIDHEQGHEWFPMIVGSDERRYAWQDEGFNTYQNTFSNERRYPRDGASLFAQYEANWRQVVDAHIDAPLMTPPDRVDADALGAIGYRKPGAVLLALRDAVVGRETLDRAFRLYVERWAFRHPTPADFFRTVESVSGEDLSWFWSAFFYGSDVLDIGIDSVATRTAGGETMAELVLRRHTSVPFPVLARLKLADGSTQDIRLPVQIWSRTDRFVASVPVRAAVTGVRLWPDGDVPDWNPANDTWGDAPPPSPAQPSTAGGMAGPIGTP